MVLQFYPENTSQIELITAQAMKAGFFGGVVVDFPNSTKAKKFFLVLMTGGAVALPKGLGEENTDEITYTNKRLENFTSKKMFGYFDLLTDKIATIFFSHICYFFQN